MNQDEKRLMERILMDTVNFYQRNILGEIMTYLKEDRKFSVETIEQFKIGYAGGGLRSYLVDELHHPAEDCLKAGVLRKNDKGAFIDYFYKRIIFPNIKHGVVVHITGRAVGEAEHKYLHLPGEMTHLFNEDALDHKEVMITEGAPDCFTAIQAGYAAVAILGTGNFKPVYVQKFSKCEKVFICMDGDDAGEKAVSRIGQYFPDKSYVVQLPQGMDLNEYMYDHSKEDFKRLVKTSKKFLSYLLEKVPSDIEKTELPGRLNELINILKKISAALAEHFLEHEIKPRFRLNAEETKAYRKMIGERRKEDHKTEKTSGEHEDIEYCAKYDGLVDLVWDNDTLSYLQRNESGLSVEPYVDLNGVRKYPPPTKNIPWMIARAGQVQASFDECCENPTNYCKKLYEDIVKHLTSVSDLPEVSGVSDVSEVSFYDLLAAWCIHTYLQESLQYSPIICFFAVPERGKSRTGKSLIYLAYRGIHVESLREAYIFRVADSFNSSIFFDVKDIQKKTDIANSEDILLQRFEKGAKVPRVNHPERGAHKDTIYYDIFGPTIIATNEGIDTILETRSIYINMPEAKRNFERDVVPKDSLELKERLTAFRAWFLGRELPDAPKPTRGRLGDILRPLRQIIKLVNPQKEVGFLSLVEYLKGERLMEKATSLEAEIVKTVHELSKEVYRGSLSVRKITDIMNSGRYEAHKLSPQRIGRCLKAMGFNKTRASNGAAAIYYDTRQIQQFLQAYGLKETSETSETSETPVMETDTPGIADAPENEKKTLFE
jgi:hypothetical protein